MLTQSSREFLTSFGEQESARVLQSSRSMGRKVNDETFRHLPERIC